MNRFNIALNVGAAGLATAVALAGCGTGQIAQTTDQVSAVNGTAGSVGDVTLRDVRIQAVEDGDFLQPGYTVDLVFVATSQSTESGDELTRISTTVGEVSMAGNRKLPAGGALIVNATGQGLTATPTPRDLKGAAAADTATATVTLDKPITNGLTYDFTFDFKRAGSISLAVPISAGPAPRR
ncbi:MAG: hypothetical protein ABI307_15415 [Mycobacterium sp.]